MVWLRRLVARVRSALAPDRLARDVDDELAFHLEKEVEARVARGMTPGAARTDALRLFGGVQRYREEVREAHRVLWFDQLRQDVAYAARTAMRAPGFTAIVVVTLALGIGATTAIFSVVRGVLLRELPFSAPDRLVRIWLANPGRDEARAPLSIPDFDDFRRITATFERMGAYSTLPTGVAIADGGEPVRLNTAYISADFFATLGARALVGRTMVPSEYEDGRDREVVISERLWKRRFGAAPDIVGRTVRLDDEPFTIVGVMPAALRFPDRETEVWVPMSVVPESGIPRVRGVRWLQVVARLAPAATVARARADLGVVATRLAREYGTTNDGWTAATVVPLREELLGASRSRVLVLFGVVLLTLVLACVNVANLVLARATRRTRELAVRTALGAGRGRIIRQLFTESLVLALLGGALGVGLAVVGVRTLVALITPWLPSVGEVRVDGAVLAFAFGVSVLTGVLFGLIPAIGRRGNLAGTLHESGRSDTGTASSHAVRRILVAVEVALAMVLVVGAGLLVRSFARLSRVDVGYETDHALMVRLTIPNSRHARPDAYLPVAYRMLDRVRQLPGVTAAALVKDGPMYGAGEPGVFRISRQATMAADAVPRAMFLPSSDGVIRALGARLEAGRDLAPPDLDSASAGAVISAALARRYWPGRSPVGEEIEASGVRLRVVGVVGDLRYTSVQGEPDPIVFVSNRIVTRRIVTIVARTRGDPGPVLAAVRGAIQSAEPDQPITSASSMRDAIGDAVASPRVLTLLVGLFGAIALVLAAVGVYGVVAYVVGQRTNEIGIRMALGAGRGAIGAWTVRTGVLPALAGLAAGGGGGLALSRVLEPQLYRVSPYDPVVFVTAALVLIAVVVVASAVPARRAVRVDPAEALRRG